MNNPTDTNQASELFSLCKKVYELTGWKQEPNISFLYMYWDNHDELCVISIEEADDTLVPAYTSDYMLEKLPPVVQDSYDKKFRHIQMWINGDGEAIACYVEPYDKEFKGAYTASSDSMLKALLKLTIALSEAGELK